MRNFMRKKLSLRKTYIRVFATFAILFTIIVALFTLYLVQVFSGSARDEIDQSAGSQLRQVMENTKFNLYKLRLYGMRMYSDESVKEWFADYRDPHGLVGLTNSIKEYMSSEPFIYNIDLISNVGRHVWTAREAMYSFEEFYDRELLEETVESSNPYLRFSRHDYQDQSFVKLVVREMGQAKPDGYLVMLIDARMLEKYVLLSNEQSLVKFMITDASGKRIIGNETPENAGVLATIHDKGESLAGSFEWMGSGEKYTVRYDTVDPEGWTVYQFTPWDMWQSKISYLRNVIMLSAGGLLLLTLFFVFWISRRNYLPFSELAGLLNRNSDETDDSIRNKADYELIRSGIGKLVSQVEQMNHSINSNQHIIREDLLRQWIRNGKQSESARSMLGQLTPIVVANRLGLAIFRIESYPSFEEKYSFFSRKLMKYAMGNIAEETIRGYGLDSVTIDFEEDHLVILWKDPKGNEETKGMLEETNRNIAQYLTIKCVGAFGVSSAASDLHALYRNVLELSFVKFLNGEEKIYDDSDRPSLPPSSSGELADDMFRQLLAAVNRGEEAEAAAVMDRIYNWLRQMPFEECKFHLTRLMYEIAKTFLHVGALQNLEGIHREVDRYGSLNELFAWLNEEIRSVTEKVRTPGREKRREDVAAAVVDFVNQNLHNPVLTVEDIGVHIGLSPNYVRSIFRDVLEITLSDFILVQRIEKAKQLLLSTEWPVTQIVEAAGFQAKSHFFTVFKKATGMTPKQYRETAEE